MGKKIVSFHQAKNDQVKCSSLGKHKHLHQGNDMTLLGFPSFNYLQVVGDDHIRG
jgi:hypothetical protein